MDIIPAFDKSLPNLRFTDAPDQPSVVDYIFKQWSAKDAYVVHFMYYASYILMQHDPAFLQSMLLANNILIDGIGAQMYFKWLMNLKVNNLNGTDLSPLVINYCVKSNIPLAFYGTTQEQITRAAEKQDEQYGKKVVYYCQNGYSALDWNAIQPESVLIIGMGSPLQENWVKNNIETLKQKKILVFTVGGFFDFASGFYIRAPKWVRKLKLEWAWRTLLHPGRHYKKRLRDTTIIIKPIIDRLKGYHKIINFLYIK